MSEVSKQLSLREVVGNVAPGVMVLLAVLYVVGQTPLADLLKRQVASGWTALLVGFVIAYGLGALLTSLTNAVFDVVTQLRMSAAPAPDLAGSTSSKLINALIALAKRAATHLSGGEDITASIRNFRRAWQEQAIAEGVLSEHALALASRHYEVLFGTPLAGEESLVFCEFYVRERMPAAMQEIEQNAAQAALMGNLIIPMVVWLVALGLSIVFTMVTDPRILRTVLNAALFAAVFSAFPLVIRVIGRQWIEASRKYVKIVVVAFVIACRVNPVQAPAVV
jgi:hypothetical protein